MSIFFKISVCLFAGLALVGVTPVHAAVLEAGVARVDITPPAGLPMYGYGGRTATAEGVLDRLYARVLALQAGDQRVALVTLDLGHAFGRAEMNQLREAARTASRVSYVIVVASHTHSGPDLLEESSSKLVADWEADALGKIGRAIDDAYRQTTPAALGTGYGESYIGHNRLYRLRVSATASNAGKDNSPAIPLERNPTKIPTSPFDPTVAVLRVDKADGTPLAILVNYACHPVIFGPDNLEYSADWPGVMMKAVEQAFDGKALCFFLQGAAGDINPYFAVTPKQDDALAKRDWTGQHLGEEAVRVARKIHTHASPEASLDFSEDLLPFHSRWNVGEIRRVLQPPNGSTTGADAHYNAELEQEEFQLPVSTVLIDKQIALMGMPGEPFVQFQMDWRNRCPVPDAFFLGYANGHFGYLPTIKGATERGYGASSRSTQIELGAGEQMVNHALVKTYEMLGLLHDVPDDLKR